MKKITIADNKQADKFFSQLKAIQTMCDKKESDTLIIVWYASF